MDILLCWSKERSRLVARELHVWLPKVLPSVKPWMSELDIDKGTDWLKELHGFLGEAKAVLVCITPENVRSPWIYYECSQVAARSESNLVCPYLLDEQPSILADGPLGRMQCTVAEKEDTIRLVKTFNKRLADRSLEDGTLGANFERNWSDLSGTLNRIRLMELPGAKVETFVSSDADQLAGKNLSSEARTMVLEVGKDRHGMLLVHSTNQGDHFQANGRELNIPQDPRNTARFREALKLLVRQKILDMQSSKIYGLTGKGYELYDILSGQSE